MEVISPYGYITVLVAVVFVCFLVLLIIKIVRKSAVFETIVAAIFAIAFTGVVIFGLTKCSSGGGESGSRENHDGVWDNARR